jgi:hypothetical protein
VGGDDDRFVIGLVLRSGRDGRPRAFSSRVVSPGGSENAPNQRNRPVDLMQPDRTPLKGRALL